MAYACRRVSWALLALSLSLPCSASFAQETLQRQDIDLRVQRFLDAHRHQWRDANVPEADGRVLHDLVLQKG